MLCSDLMRSSRCLCSHIGSAARIDLHWLCVILSYKRLRYNKIIQIDTNKLNHIYGPYSWHVFDFLSFAQMLWWFSYEYGYNVRSSTHSLALSWELFCLFSSATPRICQVPMEYCTLQMRNNFTVSTRFIALEHCFVGCCFAASLQFS